jgi:hypothetical protein
VSILDGGLSGCGRAHLLGEAKRREIGKAILRDRVVEVSPEDIVPGINNITLGQAFDVDRWLDPPDPGPTGGRGV